MRHLVDKTSAYLGDLGLPLLLVSPYPLLSAVVSLSGSSILILVLEAYFLTSSLLLCKKLLKASELVGWLSNVTVLLLLIILLGLVISLFGLDPTGLGLLLTRALFFLMVGFTIFKLSGGRIVLRISGLFPVAGSALMLIVAPLPLLVGLTLISIGLGFSGALLITGSRDRASPDGRATDVLAKQV